MTASFDIKLYGPEVLWPDRDELLDVYRDAYAEKLGSPFFSEARYWDRVESYAAANAFGLVEARCSAELVGYAMGYRLANGSRWWNGLKGEIDAEFIVEDGTRTFALTYMMVRQEHRRKGCARALHKALLGSRTERRATLLVQSSNLPARAAYYSWGWHDVGQVQPFADAPIYQAMILELR